MHYWFMTDLKQFVHSQFKLKNLVPLKYIIGLEISSSTKISLRKYALEVLLDAGI